MSQADKKNSFVHDKTSAGFVLLLTLVILVALSTLGYVLSSKLLESRSRNQYLIDYAQARYACDSAVKYSLATLSTLKSDIISRPNEPDFSDLFNLTEQEYNDFLLEWATSVNEQQGITDVKTRDTAVRSGSDINSFLKTLFAEETNEPNFTALDDYPEFVPKVQDERVPVVVRGPYGPAWPHVFWPIEFEIGTAKVTIEFEDESAKYPLSLALLSDEKVSRESEASLQTFLRWMWNRIETPDSIDSSIASVQKQLEEIKIIKQFETNFRATVTTEVQAVPSASSLQRPTAPAAAQRGARGTSTASLKPAPTRTTAVRRTVSVAEQQARQAADFAKIFHSSLIDLDMLARPTIESPTRNESALKYISLWAATKVNINTAPRQVLESVFVFGGREKEIADQIILKRRIKPFASIDEFKKELFSFSDSIDKCRSFIVTESTFFTVKITAVSGVAKVSALIAVSKEGNQARRVAIVSG